MYKKSLVILAALVATAIGRPADEKDELFQFFNGIQEFMTGEKFTDNKFYNSLVQCLKKTDEKLYTSVNHQWSGLKEYAQTGGSNADTWHKCDDNTKPNKIWFERNCTVEKYGNMPVWEPCNYASNIAYYHTVIEHCAKETWSMSSASVNTIIKSYASLGAGSSFMHMSETRVGGISDVRVNDLIGYIAFHEAMSGLKANGSILHELSETNRVTPVDKVVDDLMMMYINKPADQWGPGLSNADIASLPLSMCGFFSGALSMVLPDDITEIVVGGLLELFHAFTDRPELKEICVDKFLPAIRDATKDFRPLPLEDRVNFGRNLVGTAVKLLYAFVWQEQVITDDIVFKPQVNLIGAYLQPMLNNFVTENIETFKYSDPEFGSGKNFFAGQATCNKWDPHSKWHLQTAIALTDFIFLADEMHQLFAKHQH